MSEPVPAPTTVIDVSERSPYDIAVDDARHFAHLRRNKHRLVVLPPMIMSRGITQHLDEVASRAESNGYAQSTYYTMAGGRVVRVSIDVIEPNRGIEAASQQGAPKL